MFLIAAPIKFANLPSHIKYKCNGMLSKAASNLKRWKPDHKSLYPNAHTHT